MARTAIPGWLPQLLVVPYRRLAVSKAHSGPCHSQGWGTKPRYRLGSPDRPLTRQLERSQQKEWFAELRAYWRQLETVLGPHLYDVGLKPEQPVRIEAALMKLTANRDTPFLRMTGGFRVAPGELQRLAAAVINGVEALLYLLDQLDDLEPIGLAPTP